MIIAHTEYIITKPAEWQDIKNFFIISFFVRPNPDLLRLIGVRAKNTNQTEGWHE